MELTKSETEINMKSFRVLLSIVTSVSAIVACLMIVLGLSVYSTYHSFTFFYDDAKSGNFFTPSILCVLLGLFILVVSLFGFFGSFKESTCLVNMYALLLLVTLIVKLVIVIIAFTMDADKVMKYVHIPIKYYASDAELRAEIDGLQTTLNCCGSESYLDYIGMDFATENLPNVYTVRHIDGDTVTMLVPPTCCINSIDRECVRLRTTSCKEAVINVLVQNATVLAVLGISVLFIQTMGVIFALLLARCIRMLKSEKALVAWKIKEETIRARQDQENENKVFSIGHSKSTSIA